MVIKLKNHGHYYNHQKDIWANRSSISFIVEHGGQTRKYEVKYNDLKGGDALEAMIDSAYEDQVTSFKLAFPAVMRINAHWGNMTELPGTEFCYKAGMLMIKYQ